MKKLSNLLWHFPKVALGYKNMIEIKKVPWQAFQACHGTGPISGLGQLLKMVENRHF